MKLRLFLSISALLLCMVAFGQSYPRTTYKFTAVTHTAADTTYFTHPDLIPDGTQKRKGWYTNQAWQLNITNAPDTAKTYYALEETVLYDVSSWARTTTLDSITGNGSVQVKKDVNARNSRLYVRQGNTTGTATVNVGARIIPKEDE